MNQLTERIDSGAYSMRIYGASQATKESWQNYGRALLAIAGADGEVSEAESAWLLDHFDRLGLSREVFDSLKDFDFLSADLEFIVSMIVLDIPVHVPRMLLYDAIRMAQADEDFAEKERAAIFDMASLLGVGRDIALTIEHLIEAENALDKTRHALFQVEE